MPPKMGCTFRLTNLESLGLGDRKMVLLVVADFLPHVLHQSNPTSNSLVTFVTASGGILWL